jgi:hypothetical protein
MEYIGVLLLPKWRLTLKKSVKLLQSGGVSTSQHAIHHLTDLMTYEIPLPFLLIRLRIILISSHRWLTLFNGTEIVERAPVSATIKRPRT